MVTNGSALNVKMDELQQLARLVSGLTEIQSKVESIICILEAGGPLSLKEANPVLESALNQIVPIPQTKKLQEKVKLALEFSKAATPILECATLESLPLADLQMALTEAAKFMNIHGFHTEEMSHLWNLDAKVRVTWLSQCVLADGYKVVIQPQDGRLPLHCSETSPIHPLRNRFSEAVQQQSEGVRASLAERPSLKDGEALLEVATEMKVDEVLRARLSRAIDTGKKLCEQFWKACHGYETLNPQELCPWMEEAKKSPFCLDGVITVQEKLEKYREWQQKAEEVNLCRKSH